MAKISFDAEQVGKIADLMEDKGLTEVEIEHGDYSIRLSRGGVAQAVALPAAPAPVAAAAPAAAPTAPAAEAPAADNANHPGAVKSPMVGTAYLAAAPGKPNFVSVGDQVAEGQTLMIVEAMKVMNQIPATKAGTVKAILVADSEPVEFGQPLVIVE
ncbi:acetyl-CoA carboxylase biotin carboxyl carrier protein [Aestuariispira insulae]|uniref:Biotin carboxyl carrier protein of acetyl-CoA carboxylase n=1 Tax=Aestuariispira insulae TaxID=1461337 RepID=A0A3D9HKF9_9PROT|nr:acetyl-CoA carboxylase biotin carboxyl carrier protein [Aestuariispira insulae]RED49968.1 biotin carboxyl carrier protein [Aestuariispira insulae]